MSRVRVVKGKIVKFSEGAHNMYAGDSIVHTSAEAVSEIGAEEGVSYGSPKDPPPRPSRYFIDGYWASDREGKHKITETKLGDAVYFIIRTTKEVKEGETISVKIFDYDDSLGMDIANQDDYIELIDSRGKTSEDIAVSFEEQVTGRARQGFRLGDNLSKMMHSGFGWLFKEGQLELYAQVNYKEEKRLPLPRSKSEYLKVDWPEMDGEIVLVCASPQHLLPQMYDAGTGEPWYISFKEDVQYANKINKTLNPPSMPALEKKAYELAIRRLEKGELVFSDGSTGATSRFYNNTISDIDQRFSKEIRMGVNRGNFKKGVTSKSINQLEAMSEKGISKVFKIASDGMALLGAITDVGFMAISAHDGDRGALPFMPPFIFEEALKVVADLEEYAYSSFLGRINEVISSMKDVEARIIDWNNANENSKRFLYDWVLVRVSSGTIQKILTKEMTRIKNINEIRLNTSPSGSDGGLLIFANKEKNKYDLNAWKMYIHAIYLPEIVEA